MNFWNASTRVATAAPEVVARRVAYISQAVPWSPEAMNEMQRMVTEKMTAAVESWWVLCGGALSAGATASVAPPLWWSPEAHAHGQREALLVAHRALQPVSDVVDANILRLREH
ncbi:hypothetical protein [Sphaerotilus hippei]|nr:hypothetical protein [Sphaerotilus hippei]